MNLIIFSYALLIGFCGIFSTFAVASLFIPYEKLASKFHVLISVAMASVAMTLTEDITYKVLAMLIAIWGTYIGWHAFKLVFKQPKQLSRGLVFVLLEATGFATMAFSSSISAGCALLVVGLLYGRYASANLKRVGIVIGIVAILIALLKLLGYWFK